MERCIGVINGGQNGNKFGGLCEHRQSYMLPFGGRYRLVDFTISNMVNHGIKSVAIYTGEKMRSTMDHIGNGHPWDLNRRFNGLFLFPPIFDQHYGLKSGDIHQFHSTEPFYEHAREKYVLVCNPKIIGKVNLDEAFEHFLETDADFTLIYKNQKDPNGEFIYNDKIILDEEGNLESIGLNLGTEPSFNLYLEMAFIKKEVFLAIIRDSIEKGDIKNLRDGMLKHKNQYKINTYEFHGHVEDVRDLKSYYDANMNLLDEKISDELFYEKGLIFTKSKDEPSTWYSSGSNAKHSLIANGCLIEGDVENSIIFRGVKIGKGAIVKNSIVMQKSEIQDGAIVVNTILDKYTCVEKGARIAGSTSLPYVVKKNHAIKKEEY